MKISEVRVKLVERPSERLRAFCSVTLDGDFVIRDLKIIDGANGPFVAMPSRKLADRCPRCGCKNHLRARFCNDCGQKLNENRAPKDAQGRSKLHADVAHPINAGCRERIQQAVIEAFHAELELSKSPDYQPPKFDDLDEEMEDAAVEPQRADAAPVPAAGAPVKTEAREPQADESGFGDYNALIADLKREAAGRRDKQDTGRWSGRTEDARVRQEPEDDDNRGNVKRPSAPPPSRGSREPRPRRREHQPAVPPAPVEGDGRTTPAETPAVTSPAPQPSHAGQSHEDDSFAAGL